MADILTVDPAPNRDATGNGPPDGIVNVNDLNAVIVGWGDCPAASVILHPRPGSSRAGGLPYTQSR